MLPARELANGLVEHIAEEYGAVTSVTLGRGSSSA
jgi:hypothetical protein